jgi:RNA polymerase sigma-70 factor (ECF subfamily)
MKLLINGTAASEHAAPEMPAEDPLASLVAGAAAGDRQMMGGILQAVAPAVLTVVRVILGPDNPDVPDVAQEGLMALRDALRIFRRESSVTQYAKQVAVRTALTARRRWRSREQRLQEFRRETETGSDADNTDDPLIRARRTAAFRALLDDLPDAQAETFALRVVLDYTLPQVASATGVPINTVRSRVRLAKEKLRRRIETDPALYDILRGGEG